MGSTREGEIVDSWESNLRTRYGQLIQGITGSAFTKFIKVADDGSQIIGNDSGEITIENPLSVKNVSFIDVNNSTTIPLAADTGGSDHIFTGVATDVLNVTEIAISIKTDTESAINGLSLQTSCDGTNWDFEDVYTILGSEYKEEVSLSPKGCRYFRVVYTNGTVAQTYLRLNVILKGVRGKPSSHRLKDELSEEDDAELVKAVISYPNTDDGKVNNVSTNNPFPIDGDSVYAKDLDLENCTASGFTFDVGTGTEQDVIRSLVSSIFIGKSNDSTNNPKTIYLQFKRPVATSFFGLNSAPGKYFSNLKIVIGQGDYSETIFDGSADNTLRQIFIVPTGPIKFSSMTLTFHTVNEIGIGLIGILKDTSVVARLQALKPDGTVTDLDATAGGNLKISLEELESGISSNSNSQLNITQYKSDGTELEIDSSNGAICTTSYEHCEIHSGNHFYIKGYMDLTNAQVFDFLVVTPNTTRWAHMISEFSFEGEANVEIYEGTITSNDGTSINTFNRNRNSSTNSTITFTHTPTVTTPGTLIAAYKTGSGQKIGGEAQARQELVLKQNTKYLIRLTNATALNNWVDYLADWYEHTNL